MIFGALVPIWQLSDQADRQGPWATCFHFVFRKDLLRTYTLTISKFYTGVLYELCHATEKYCNSTFLDFKIWWEVLDAL